MENKRNKKKNIINIYEIPDIFIFIELYIYILKLYFRTCHLNTHSPHLKLH